MTYKMTNKSDYAPWNSSLLSKEWIAHTVKVKVASITGLPERKISELNSRVCIMYVTLCKHCVRRPARDHWAVPRACFWLDLSAEAALQAIAPTRALRVRGVIFSSAKDRLRGDLTEHFATRQSTYSQYGKIEQITVQAADNVACWDKAMDPLKSHPSVMMFPRFWRKVEEPAPPIVSVTTKFKRDLQAATGLSDETAEQLLASGVDHMRHRQPLPQNRMRKPQV
jgi:hypothetical protein